MFDVGESTATKWLSIATRGVTIDFNRRLAPTGVNASQHFYILKIHDNPGITQDQLIESDFLNQSNVTRAISQLEKLGLVHKNRDAQDKRKFVLSLTAQGDATYPQIKRALAEQEASIMQVAQRNNPNFDPASFVAALRQIAQLNHH